MHMRTMHHQNTSSTGRSLTDVLRLRALSAALLLGALMWAVIGWMCFSTVQVIR